MACHERAFGLPLGKPKASRMAGPTGLEPATSGVTGRRSNQLNYDPAIVTGDITATGCCRIPRQGSAILATGGGKVKRFSWGLGGAACKAADECRPRK